MYCNGTKSTATAIHNRTVINIWIPSNALDRQTKCWLKLVVAIFITLLILVVCLNTIYVRSRVKCRNEVDASQDIHYSTNMIDHVADSDMQQSSGIPSPLSLVTAASMQHHSHDGDTTGDFTSAAAAGGMILRNQHTSLVLSTKLHSISEQLTWEQLIRHLQLNQLHAYAKFVEELNVTLAEVLLLLDDTNRLAQHNLRLFASISDTFDMVIQLVSVLSQLLLLVLTGTCILMATGIFFRRAENNTRTERIRIRHRKRQPVVLLPTSASMLAAAVRGNTSHSSTCNGFNGHQQQTPASSRSTEAANSTNTGKFTAAASTLLLNQSISTPTSPYTTTTHLNSSSLASASTPQHHQLLNSSDGNSQCQGWSVTAQKRCLNKVRRGNRFCHCHRVTSGDK